jgi:predicted permease
MRAILEGLVAWVRRVTGREGFEEAMSEEIQAHIEMQADELERRGMPRADALRKARLAFGAVERYRQEGRDGSVYRFFDELHADLRDAFRGLKRDRSFSVVAVSVIASVLAANMVLFAFLDAYFLRPLPIEGARRHVELSARDAEGRWQGAWPLKDALSLIAPDNPVLEKGYGFAVRRTIVRGREPLRAYVEVVTPSYFDLVKPKLAMGRALSAATGGPAEQAIMLSHTGWKRLTGADPGIIGKALLVDGVSLTVVGVLQERTGGLEPVTPEFWVLAGAADAASNTPTTYALAGLLRDGVSPEQASAALTSILRGLSPGSGLAAETIEARVEPRTTLLRESKDLEPLAVSLLFLFGLVTVVAAANLTSLHLARATARRHDLSIRAALGASRERLVRHLITEGLVVSFVAAGIAWGLSVASVAAVQGIVFSIVSDAGMSMLPVEVDARIVAAALALAFVIGIGCALVPALSTTRMNRSIALKRDGLFLGGMMSAGRLRGALVGFQVALSFPLLVSAGVLVRSAEKAARVDAGYRLEGLIDLRAEPPSTQLVERLRSLPGVASISAVAQTPLAGDSARVSVRFDGSEAIFGTNAVDEHFFRTLGIEVRQGRNFLPHETASRAPVAVISAATAKRLWPGQNPLGRTLSIGDEDAPQDYLPHEVVGVADDVMSGFFFRGKDESAIYRPASLESGSAPRLLMRLDETGAESLGVLKATCQQIASFCDPYTLERMLGMQRVPFAVGSLIASSLGVLALGLACLGLHGLVRFAVVQRAREFGVRLALGATRRQILLNVLGGSLRRVGLGIGVGLPGCLALSTFVASRIPHPVLEMFDPTTYALVPLMLLASALLASLMPALRAAATDPIKALREE